MLQFYPAPNPHAPPLTVLRGALRDPPPRPPSPPQCKCLRVLQFYPAPENPADRASLNSMLQNIIDTSKACPAMGGSRPAALSP